jgi:hypothetical protein
MKSKSYCKNNDRVWRGKSGLGKQMVSRLLGAGEALDLGHEPVQDIVLDAAPLISAMCPPVSRKAAPCF